LETRENMFTYVFPMKGSKYFGNKNSSLDNLLFGKLSCLFQMGGMDIHRKEK